MVTVIVVVNLALALILLYAAWRVRKLRRRLTRWADRLTALERSTNVVLPGVPEAISKGQGGVYRLRQGHEPLQLQLQRVRQVLSLLSLGQQIWQRAVMTWPLSFPSVRGTRSASPYKDATRSQLFKKPLSKYR